MSKILNPKKLTIMIFSLMLIVYLVAMKQSAYNGAVRGMYVCVSVILPTVFPFAVASDIFAESGLCSAVGRAAPKFIKKLFCLSDTGFGILILGLFGGFPTGADTASKMYKCGVITRSEAERLICVSNNPSVAYSFMLGAMITSSLAGGAMLWITVIISSILYSLVIRVKDYSELTGDSYGSFSDLSLSIRKASLSTVCICGTVIFFSALGELISSLPVEPVLHGILLSFVELTSGLDFLLNTGGDTRLIFSLTAGLLSFSGLSVMMQVKAAIRDSDIGITKYFFGKILQGIFSFALSYLCFEHFITLF